MGSARNAERPLCEGHSLCLGRQRVSGAGKKKRRVHLSRPETYATKNNRLMYHEVVEGFEALMLVEQVDYEHVAEQEAGGGLLELTSPIG